jgi:hypothetical protein
MEFQEKYVCFILKNKLNSMGEKMSTLNANRVADINTSPN